MKVTVLVDQLCPTLCDPMDCTHQAPLCMGFSRQEYWSGLPCPHPGDLPDLGMEPCRSCKGSPVQCPLVDRDVYSAVLGCSFPEVSVGSAAENIPLSGCYLITHPFTRLLSVPHPVDVLKAPCAAVRLSLSPQFSLVLLHAC